MTIDEALVASRYELQAYLEGRGFAVYDSENTEDLRHAALLDADSECLLGVLRCAKEEGDVQDN